MELGVNSLLMCLFVGLLSHSQGLQFTLDSTPDTFYCAHLHCFGDVSQNDARILSVVGLSISSIVQSNTLIKLASISAFDPIPQVEPTKVHDLNVTGSVSRYHANLDLSLHNRTDCVMTSFVCELDFVNVSGQTDMIREVVTPVDTTNCDEVDRKLTDIEGKLTELKSQNTAMDVKLADLNVKLTDVDDNLTDVNGKLADVDVKLADVDGKLAELGSQNTATKQELAGLEIKLDSVLGYLARLEALINTSQSAVGKFTCARGAPHDESREKFFLWGRVPALCDTETDGGGWVIIQRRTKGDVDFYKGWDDYKKGFGTLDTDFWLGNDNIHNLTSQGYTNLRVDMEYQGVKYFAEYSNFSVADEISKYKLTAGGYHGNATGGLSYNSGMLFSTFDRDNDIDNTDSCAGADQCHGAWWYGACSFSNLNGLWGAKNSSGLYWFVVVYPGSVTWSEMKVRQV